MKAFIDRWYDVIMNRILFSGAGRYNRLVLITSPDKQMTGENEVIGRVVLSINQYSAINWAKIKVNKYRTWTYSAFHSDGIIND